MRQFLLALPACALILATVSASAAAEKPNFVFFLVDDLGWGDLGCYGSTFHETPNLDRLAAEGMKFNHAYSACTVCSPSRAAILTGQYPGRLHLTDWIAGHRRGNPKLLIPKWNMRMEHELTTLPEALKEAGYRTAFVGKWHLMPIGAGDFKEHFPESHGFDLNVGGREWGQPKGPGKYFSPFGMPGLDDGEKGDYLTDKLTDAAVEFIGEQKDNPFLLYFSYYTVHGPIMARPDLLAKYQAKAKNFDNTRGERVHAAYAGMVESLDQSVGRVMEKLEEAGVAENTVVVFTADNGGTSQQSSGGLRGAKALAYEGGTREPLLVKWPGKVKPGSSCDAPVIGTDFYPTFLEMAGLPARPDAHKDGLSLVPLLNGKADTLGREALYWHYPHYHKTKPYGAVRHGDWKLIEFFEDERLELYDLGGDPAESEDLAASNPEKTKELAANLRAWRESVRAQMPTPNPAHTPGAEGKPRKPKRKPLKKAPGKASASSFQNGNPPGNALDGLAETRWAADGGSVPQWWMIEFPESRELEGLTIHWKNRTWFSHKVEVSADGSSWKLVANDAGSKGERLVNEHAFETTAKFLRVTVDGLGSGWVSFTELEPKFAD